MCGRYQLSTEDEIFEIREIMKELNRQMLSDVKTGDIYPTDLAPTLILPHAPVFEERKREWEQEQERVKEWKPLAETRATAMRWGFPKWDGKGHIINARAETAPEKPMFKSALAQRRCVIPSTGFYEWTHPENASRKKEKYLLRLKDRATLFMAGIYTDEERFAILTTAANESVLPLHSRMPVILAENELLPWLSDIEAALDIMHQKQPELTLKKLSPSEQLTLF